VEHAYPGGPPGEVRVRGRLDGSGAVELSVRDFGHWRPVDPEPGLRGRGLILMRRCMHNVVVDRAAEGTTVLMRRLLRTEPLLDPPASGRAVAHVPEDQVQFATRVHTGAPGGPVRVEVSGPVDMNSAPRLRAVLNEAGRGGVLPLTVDLHGVTHLGSSGIQLLADLAGAGRPRLRLIAEPGSIARHVLDLTGLGHLAADDG
jgi:anti-anti-sigma factor